MNGNRLAQVKIAAGTEDDLLAIVGILNFSAANSIAHFDTRPVSVAERGDWFGQFSATGPYRLLAAWGGDQLLGYACSQRYRDHEAFRETVEVSIALDVTSRGRASAKSLKGDAGPAGRHAGDEQVAWARPCGDHGGSHTCRIIREKPCPTRHHR